jgi:hypothetical protein
VATPAEKFSLAASKTVSGQKNRPVSPDPGGEGDLGIVVTICFV